MKEAKIGPRRPYVVGFSKQMEHNSSSSSSDFDSEAWMNQQASPRLQKPENDDEDMELKLEERQLPWA